MMMNITHVSDNMMLLKIGALCGVLLVLTGCGSSNLPAAAGPTTSPWYQAGQHDALAGKAVRDNDTLAEWFGNPQIDRDAYLKGYTAGQTELCQEATMHGWGEQGRNFPASCDGVAGAEQLKQQWQAGMDHHNP